MARYNLFHPLHKSLRMVLHETNFRVQSTDFTREQEAAETVHHLQCVIRFLKQYRQAVEGSILPPMEAYEPGVADSLEQDHEAEHLLWEKIQHALHQFSKLSKTPEKVGVGTTLIRLVEESTLLHLLHLRREENLVNTVLWRFYTDAELQAIARTIFYKTGQPAAMPFAGWLLRGLNDQERIRWQHAAENAAGEADFLWLNKRAAAPCLPQGRHPLQPVFSGDTLVA